MSTFGGKLLEESLSEIRIDNFEAHNFDGKYFFLSHLHTDHMKGLFSDEFTNLIIKSAEKKLFCSPLTRRYLLNNKKCIIPCAKICEMSLNASYVFLQNNQPDIEVTLLPAGHCPGSVMIYMVQAGLRVLYTGDFRVTAFDLNKYKVLKNRSGDVMPLHTLYLDTTFCDPNWLTFPHRITTNDDILAIILDWILQDPSNEIGLWYISHHGLESLLVQLALHILIKTKIWIIDQEAYANYACITELHDVICKEKGTSRIHICPVKTKGNCFVCQSNRSRTITIKPVAMSFHQQQLNKSRTKKENFNLVKVAYSTHCSLEELIGIYKFLKPKRVIPCVKRPGLTDRQVLQHLEIDVEKYKKNKLEEENKENHPGSNPTTPPPKRHCFVVKKECAGTSASSSVPIQEEPNSAVPIKEEPSSAVPIQEEPNPFARMVHLYEEQLNEMLSFKVDLNSDVSIKEVPNSAVPITEEPNSPVAIKQIEEEPNIEEDDEMPLLQSEILGMDSPPF